MGEQVQNLITNTGYYFLFFFFINESSFTKKILVENYLIDSDDYRVINTLVYQGRVKGFFVFLDY